jgi:serine/tyrosine/threonine adenylyltransferase
MKDAHPAPEPPAEMVEIDAIHFGQSYASLPGAFHSRTAPTPVAEPRLIHLNRPLAESLGLDPTLLESREGVSMLAGNRIPNSAEPIAMAYAGHQFGNWVPQLGDGRAILLGELVDREGVRRDVQLKGAGRTAFSRRGDGRSSIGPAIREYLGSEAMAALGIPTTRALAVLSTGEEVLRERPEPGGILVRVATSHVRVGTFEYFARRGDAASVARLADFVIERHYPHLVEHDDRYRELLAGVVRRTADLVANWLLVGFIHGVMNTDNTSVVGETIDYGPFGFLDPYRPDEVYSSIDWQGRYAFNQQPGIAHWNLARLAETLLTLLADEPEKGVERAQEVLADFPDRFKTTFHRGLVAKIGLSPPQDDAGSSGSEEAGGSPLIPPRADPLVTPGPKPAAADVQLALDLLERMAREKADMTRTFRELSELDRTPNGGGTDASASGVPADTRGDEAVRSLFDDPTVFDEWAHGWRARLAREPRDDQERIRAMKRVNPSFILRNHLAQEAVDAAVEELDFEPMQRLLPLLARPFDDHPEDADTIRPPAKAERVTRTFCGT